MAIVFKGIDAKTMRHIYHFHEYTASHLLLDATFVPMVKRKRNKVTINFKHFHSCNALYPVNRAKPF